MTAHAMRMPRTGLRIQLIVAFVAVATVAALTGALLAAWCLHDALHGPAVIATGGPSSSAVLIVDHHALEAEVGEVHIWAMLMAVGVAAAVGLLMAGRLTRPLRSLSVAAGRLSEGGRGEAAPSGGSREIAALASSLDTLAADLDRQRAGRRRLAEDLAHELRTPLTLIQMRIEAMQDGVRPLDAEGLGSLHTEALRLGRLVDRIERIAEAEAQEAPTHEPVDLAEIARTAHRTHAGAFALRGTELHLAAAPAPTAGDPDALSELVANLLANSLRYSQPAHPVTLATALEDGHAVLRVEDGGALDPDEAEAVFARFHRGSAATEARAPGSGLGLTIGRDTARRHGGDLVLVPTGTGTRAQLSLPAVG